jgi:hypothetical protein
MSGMTSQTARHLPCIFIALGWGLIIYTLRHLLSLICLELCTLFLLLLHSNLVREH